MSNPVETVEDGPVIQSTADLDAVMAGAMSRAIKMEVIKYQCNEGDCVRWHHGLRITSYTDTACESTPSIITIPGYALSDIHFAMELRIFDVMLIAAKSIREKEMETV